jgi:DNA repair protein RadC
MKLLDLCADERPREKMLERGAAALSNAELLAILLRTGTGKMNVVEVAQTMLRRAEGRLDTLAGMSVDALCRTDGIGPGKAVTIAAAFELGRRWFAEEGAAKRSKIQGPEMVCRMMYPVMKNLEIEECWAIYMNNTNYCLGKERLSVGGLEATVLDCKVLLRKALEKKAAGIILVHNHPSGTAYPSTADIERTRMVRNALKACDISLVDHVIIGSRNYYSFSDERIADI